MELIQGNHACAEGAIKAGVRFYGGYPITPSSEVAEFMAARLPKVGGVFMQMEDEIASLGACVGARLSGMKSMTATSGPGFSLMQEHIGFAAITEVPILVVNVMRGGPSTGLPTKTAQADIMQSRWGSHGDFPVAVLAPWSVAECFDLTTKAINISERLRIPVTVLSDEVLGHMREGLEFPEEVEVYDAGPLKVSPADYKPYEDGTEYDSPRANYGQGYHFHVTGLSHGKNGFPTNNPEVIAWMMDRLARKIADNTELLTDFRVEGPEDPDVLLVAIGSVARSSIDAIRKLEKQGVRAGLFRPRILWPFPEKGLAKAAAKASAIFVPEMSQGQLIHPVREVIQGIPIHGINKYNGEHMTPDEMLHGVKKHLRARVTK